MKTKKMIVIVSALVAASFLLGAILHPGLERTEPEPEPAPVIIDTDIGNSTDDLFALEIAYRLMDLGLIDVKGIVVSRMGEGYPALADIMNTYYDYPDIPIGVERNGVTGSEIHIDYRMLDDLHNSDGSKMFRRTDLDFSDNPDGYKLYRKILSEAEDHSVKIIIIGFVSSLVQLMESLPDEISPLSGRELLSKKADSLYFMATKLGEDNDPGYNLRYDISLAKRFLDGWPADVPVYLSPSPVGGSVEYTEEMVLSDLSYDENNPIRQTYLNRDCNTGQKMWDHMCVINAVFPEYFEYSPRGTLSVLDDGTVSFARDPDGPFCYQILGDDAWVDQQFVYLRFFTLMH